MPSNAFLFRMPAGIPGMVNRTQSATVEAQLLDTTNYPTVYGVPVAIDATSKAVRKITTGDAAAAIYGMYVRPYPTNSNQDALGTSTPATSGIANVLKRGYMSVSLGGATAAAKNGTVYVRVAAAAAGKPIGGIEAAADSTNTIVMANAYFTGPADASGNVEIAFNL
jgi:hypothetical protein